MNISRSKKHFIKVFLLLAVASVSACSSLPSQLTGEPGAGVLEDHYLLGPDDVISVTVFNHPEWSGEYVIGPDGKITVPSLGEMHAEGLYKEQFALIYAAYLEKYIHDPKVTVNIVTYASEVIYVLGEVNEPGRYPTEGKNITLRDAVINAGLPTEYAATKRVFVISASRKKPRREVVNLYRILYRGELERNLNLKPGDVVYIPRTVVGMIGELISALFRPFGLSTVTDAATVVVP